MNTIFIIHFRNHDTFLCIFNYKIGAEIANLHQLCSEVVIRELILSLLHQQHD